MSELYPNITLTLDHCVKCNICQTACPVSNVTPLFPGPKYAGPQSQRFRDLTPDVPTVDSSVDYCSGCGICDLVCPQGVKIMEINSKARAHLYEQTGIPLRNRLISRSELLGRLAHPVVPLANWALHNPVMRWLVERTLGIDQRAPLPSFSSVSFAAALRQYRKTHPEPTGNKEVVYFHACSTQWYEPRIGLAAIKVLERNGYRVVIPSQGCCGLPILSQGDFDTARRFARRNLNTLAPLARQGQVIIGTSTSCTLSLKHDYLEILDLRDEDARVVADNTWDICEFLLALHERGELDTNFKLIERTYPYHAPCQQKAHGIGKPALDLLSLIPSLTLIEMQADCCGIAGTYEYKQEKYDIGMAVGEKLFNDLRASQATQALCDSETCRWQITHGTGLPAFHPIEVLAEAYE